MKYETINGITIDLSNLRNEEKNLVVWLKDEYATADSWIGFQSRTSHGAIESSKTFFGDNWNSHPLYLIQVDLVANKGVELGELSGRNSRMFYY